MNKPFLSPTISKNGLTGRIPNFDKEQPASKPLGELASETIITAVSKYPATALAGGFILGGLLGWLLTRSK